jgi:hypothetical protein
MRFAVRAFSGALLEQDNECNTWRFFEQVGS